MFIVKLKLLDLFCGAGGCSMGYHLAGFDVTGVDIKPQPNYPFKFIQADALGFDLVGYDVIHASPVCYAYSQATAQNRIAGKVYPDQIDFVRKKLSISCKPYVIENVPGSPLRNYIELSGKHFGLKVIRKRWFESNMFLLSPGRVVYPKGTIGRDGYVTVVGSLFPSLPSAQKAMGIDWMTRKELALSIPPAYTKFIGEQILNILSSGRAISS